MHNQDHEIIELKLIEIAWKALDAGMTSNDIRTVVDQALQVWAATS